MRTRVQYEKVTIDALPLVRDMPALTARQMAAADRIASEELGIPLEALMENAAHQIAVATRLFLGDVAGRRIVAVAGTGNNGGDALAALRHLHGWGAHAQALVAAPHEALRPLAALQREILTRTGIPTADTSPLDAERLAERVAGADVVLDGLLGYNAKGAPRGEVARLVHVLAVHGSGRIVAVDLPSGLDPDSGAALGEVVVAADLTVTLALPKTGLLAHEAESLVGELVLADIGIPPEAYARFGVDARAVFAQGDLIRVAPR